MKNLFIKYRYLIFFIFLGFLYYILGIDSLDSNDALTNILQIEEGNIFYRTSHFMFNFLGVLFYFVFGKLFNLSATATTEIMLLSFSLLASIMLFLLVDNLYGDKNIALLSSFVYSFSSGIWRLSIQPEYLVLVPSFSIISLYLFIKDKNFFSGIIYGFGLLTSPFILSFFPAFFIRPEPSKKLIKKIIVLFIGAILSYGIVNIFTFDETVSGEWSYGYVLSYYFKELKIFRSVLIFIYGYLRSFNILLIVLILSIILFYNQYRRLIWVTILLFIFHIPWIFNEARLGAYQFPIYPFIAILIAILLINKYKKFKFLFLSLIIFYFISNFSLILFEKNYKESLRDDYIKMNYDSSIPDSSYIFVYQATRPIKIRYAPRLIPVGLIHDMHMDKIKVMNKNFKEPKIEEILDTPNNKYVFEAGVLPPDDYIKNLFRNFLNTQGAKTKGFAVSKLSPYLGNRKLVKLDGYNFDFYYIK